MGLISDSKKSDFLISENNNHFLISKIHFLMISVSVLSLIRYFLTLKRAGLFFCINLILLHIRVLSGKTGWNGPCDFGEN